MLSPALVAIDVRVMNLALLHPGLIRRRRRYHFSHDHNEPKDGKPLDDATNSGTDQFSLAHGSTPFSMHMSSIES